MTGFESPALLWLFVIAQVFGLLSAWFARLSEGSLCQTFCQCLVFLTLPIVGILNVMALTIGAGWWLVSSTTLAAMILMVTWDFSGGSEAATY
jgi:hypothetical protein